MRFQMSICLDRVSYSCIKFPMPIPVSLLLSIGCIVGLSYLYPLCLCLAMLSEMLSRTVDMLFIGTVVECSDDGGKLW